MQGKLRGFHTLQKKKKLHFGVGVPNNRQLSILNSTSLFQYNMLSTSIVSHLDAKGGRSHKRTQENGPSSLRDCSPTPRRPATPTTGLPSWQQRSGAMGKSKLSFKPLQSAIRRRKPDKQSEGRHQAGEIPALPGIKRLSGRCKLQSSASGMPEQITNLSSALLRSPEVFVGLRLTNALKTQQ